MTQPANDDDSRVEPTFTRAQMAKMVNAQVREKVAAELDKYGDLDELRAKAAEADKSASQLDRIEQQLRASEERAAKAERSELVRRVADELGISVRMAGKLDGKTFDELLADGKETMEDLGLEPKSKSDGKATTKTGKGEGDSDDATDEDDDAQDAEPKQTPPTRQTAPARTARPRETLRSGAARTATEPEETNPLKLVENIPRR